MLPVSGYRDEDPCNFTVISILSGLGLTEGRGYVAEVFIIMPQDIHDYTNPYPLAPNHMAVTQDHISPYSQRIREARGMTRTFKTKKLAPSLYPKDRYVVHLPLLKLYIELGAQLKKVYRVISYKEERIFAPYIDYLSEQRRRATNESSRQWYKLLRYSAHFQLHEIQFN